jgi:hypothetical protein
MAETGAGWGFGGSEREGGSREYFIRQVIDVTSLRDARNREQKDGGIALILKVSGLAAGSKFQRNL